MNMLISCVQTKAYSIYESEEGLEHSLNLLDQALEHGPELVVLPECVYPAYYLRDFRPEMHRPFDDVIRLFAHRAKKHHAYIAVGLVEGTSELYNSVFLLGPDGNIVGHARKELLWHFDSKWFTPGCEHVPVSIKGTTAGMFVCADGRQPEISRILRIKGARMLIDVTNWVTTGRDLSNLPNPQPDFIMRVRAMENAAWVLAANKVGRELDSVLYCGKSLVINPAGEVVAQAPSDQPTILLAEVDADAEGLKARPHPVRDRRPELYGGLLEKGNVEKPRRDEIYVALAQVDPGEEPVADTVLRFAGYAQEQGADLVIFPELPAGTYHAVKDVLSAVSVLTCFTTINDGKKVTCILKSGRTLHEYCRVHATEEEGITPGQSIDVADLTDFVAGVIQDAEGLIPEQARILALAGMHLLIWPGDCPEKELVAKARAAENRIFVASVTSPSGSGSFVINPYGAVMGGCPPGLSHMAIIQVPVVLAASKQLAPYTDGFLGRIPAAYREIAGW
ncbi:MAG: carbon-nitrogen hydrolase family protein [Bacillota bacterium]